MGTIKGIQLSVATDLKEITNEYRAALVAFDDAAAKLKTLKSNVENKKQNAIGMAAKYSAQSKELAVDPSLNKDYDAITRLLSSPTLSSSLYKNA